MHSESALSMLTIGPTSIQWNLHVQVVFDLAKSGHSLGTSEARKMTQTQSEFVALSFSSANHLIPLSTDSQRGRGEDKLALSLRHSFLKRVGLIVTCCLALCSAIQEKIKMADHITAKLRRKSRGPSHSQSNRNQVIQLAEHSLDNPQTLPAEPSITPTLVQPQQQQREHVRRYRPVHLLTSLSPISDTGGSLPSPIYPSPLRIRKSKSSAQPGLPAEMKVVRLMIASLGNPPPYHTTRHSAGHILLKGMVQSLRLPTLAKDKALGNGLVSSGTEVGRSEYTLWQSTSMMNVSGAGLLRAWRQFTSFHHDKDIVTALVILHDELESNPGTVKLRRGESSPKGHNGIKSVQSSLKSAGLLTAMGDRFLKIGIGIGRPTSRERDDVSAWVLGQVTQVERTKLDAATESALAVIQSEIGKLERS